MVTTGDWILGRTIGSGATATVSLASTRSSGEVFAVKSSPITSSALLQREQSILCSLSFPHIISCLGSDTSTDSYHLFLELAGRGTLSDLAGLVDELEIRSITHQILLALCYLKSAGFAHCDIKGKNVLIGSDGLVKLGDFGCARRVEANACVPVMGTPAFMAPEAARGEEQGFAGDIWSLGCTVVEMATGRSPWPEITDAVSALYRIGFTSDSPIIPGWISEEGKDFVSKCFVRDPKQRWTAEQLLRHPFVAAEPPLQILLPNEKQGRWVSPKSILELNSWESESECGEDEDDERGVVESESFSDRIRRLSSPAPANWTWTDSWIPVRSINYGEEKRQIGIAGEEEASSAGADSMEAEEELASCCLFIEVEEELRSAHFTQREPAAALESQANTGRAMADEPAVVGSCWRRSVAAGSPATGRPGFAGVHADESRATGDRRTRSHRLSLAKGRSSAAGLAAVQAAAGSSRPQPPPGRPTTVDGLPVVRSWWALLAVRSGG
ncbi:Mitogen-activated protein kinase kinase kinase 2 [Platanthera guangdongensis]|uniref:Mitogen-activated protein kinase kinase kinase 2 n=1 Tax=Platanthera guangdongensis TaxID=2320717 RepID=A0ABR2M3S9_9ASPA